MLIIEFVQYVDSIDQLAIGLGESQKAQLSAKAMFELVHQHGDILREGWKNIFDCLLQLYKARLLPNSLTEVEDFLNDKGWISIVPEKQPEAKREDVGLLSSMFLYLGGAENKDQKGPTAEEQEFIRVAQQTINDCHLETVVTVKPPK